MDTQQFLAYLNEHTDSRDLAAEVAELLAARGGRRLVVATGGAGKPLVSDRARIAS